ncbi:MAG: hypothetical protein SVU32_09680 [Candidatus Nanohaloarchaea archaeon]|nr:hypothetical protein [Candidatus Nanohaloarchaea archaeon]
MGLQDINRVAFIIKDVIAVLLVLGIIVFFITGNQIFGDRDVEQKGQVVESFRDHLKEEACRPLDAAGTLPPEDAAADDYNFNGMDVYMQSGKITYDTGSGPVEVPLDCDRIQTIEFCSNTDWQSCNDGATFSGEDVILKFHFEADQQTVYVWEKTS